MISRRQLGLGLAAASISTPALALVGTPKQTTGPFYPEALPSESDADLVRIGNGAAAQGEEIEIVGRVLGSDGRPIREAFVELWQANTHGRYAHSRDTSPAPLDPNFQGFGTVLTDEQGRYRFRTIKPGVYPGRTRHLHFRIGGPGFEPLPTQMYFAGDPGNSRDFLWNSIRNPEARESVTVAFARSAIYPTIETGRFDIVL
ncbi:UNVERIFIED_CONTAM: hypothetical protein GTU68_048841 [Idotea baltica]|nr:hypothetical protein [Idotea baltica]